MLDLTQLKVRYYEIRLPDGTEVAVKPPKIKALRKIMELSGGKDNAADDLSEAARLILSNNKTGRKFTATYIDDKLDYDELRAIINGFFGWVTGIKRDPN